MSGVITMRVAMYLTAAAGIALMAGGGTAGYAGLAAQPAAASEVQSASHVVVAYDFWHGSKGSWTSRPCEAVRPQVLGGKFGEPVQSIRWASWGGTATGHGYFTHMGYSSAVTIYLHDVRSVHGVRYFELERVHFSNGNWTNYGHWTGHNWAYSG